MERRVEIPTNYKMRNVGKCRGRITGYEHEANKLTHGDVNAWKSDEIFCTKTFQNNPQIVYIGGPLRDAFQFEYNITLYKTKMAKKATRVCQRSS